MTVHLRIKELRGALHLTQRQFGERLGVSRDVIGNLECGRVKPRSTLLRHICECFGVQEEWLYYGKGEMFAASYPKQKKADEALSLFKNLNPTYQEYALQQIKGLLDLQEKQKK